MRLESIGEASLNMLIYLAIQLSNTNIYIYSVIWHSHFLFFLNNYKYKITAISVFGTSKGTHLGVEYFGISWSPLAFHKVGVIYIT